MINSVRNTVLSVLNKNNYGYISPADFNLFAKQAQIEIFENYFNKYNYQIIKENARQSGTDDADIAKSIAETIERFSTSFALLPIVFGQVSNYMTLPDDYFKIQKINYYPTTLTTGAATSLTSGRLVDSGATFTTDGVVAGSVVANTATGSVAYVIAVVSDTEIILTKDIMEVITETYSVSSTTGVRDMDKVSQSRVTMLNNSNLTAPTTTFPVYVLGESESVDTGEVTAVYPIGITTPGSVITQHIRYPRDPKWTYADVPTASGEPLYDPTQTDFQDFELPLVDEHTLVFKILEYAGVSIRELPVAEIAAKLEDRETNLEK